MSKRVREREPYERPRIRKIMIVAEEMAVAGCKTRQTVRGPSTGCIAVNCRNLGS